MRVLALLACGAAATAPDWPAVRARGANASFSFPAFYVGGAAKCGTTTLSAWFAQHGRRGDHLRLHVISGGERRRRA